jgi:hypothetical protein
MDEIIQFRFELKKVSTTSDHGFKLILELGEYELEAVNKFLVANREGVLFQAAVMLARDNPFGTN